MGIESLSKFDEETRADVAERRSLRLKEEELQELLQFNKEQIEALANNQNTTDKQRAFIEKGLLEGLAGHEQEFARVRNRINELSQKPGVIEFFREQEKRIQEVQANLGLTLEKVDRVESLIEERRSLISEENFKSSNKEVKPDPWDMIQKAEESLKNPDVKNILGKLDSTNWQTVLEELQSRQEALSTFSRGDKKIIEAILKEFPSAWERYQSELVELQNYSDRARAISREIEALRFEILEYINRSQSVDQGLSDKVQRAYKEKVKRKVQERLA